jgi:hypothetical protein
MAVLLFRLQNVPDDEAMDIRELLGNAEIYFYETHAGFWRMGVDAIWLPDNSHEERARELIQQYQLQRTSNEQKNYAELVERGESVTLWQNLCAHPFRALAGVIAIAFVLLLSFSPFAFMFKL